MRQFIGHLWRQGRRATWVVAGVVALGGAIAVPAQASATQASGHAPVPHALVAPEIHLRAPAAICPAKMRCAPSISSSVSGNWSGYAQTGSGYSSVSATWTVPSVSSTGSTFSDSSTWVGIDGDNNGSLIQTGTEQGWNPSTNSAFYDAWWEILPANETVMFNVSPGDNIYASVSLISGNTWSIYLLDRNSGNVISQTKTYTGPRTSAEFIQEAPTTNGNVDPVAHYSPVTFLNARINGQSPNLFAGQSIVMDQNGSQVSTPSDPNEALNGFTVSNGSGTPSAPPTRVFQRHSDGSVWQSTGVACNGGSCPGWVMLDANSADVRIAAGAGTVYQLHNDGSIWEWMGGACSGTFCPGWVELDNNRAAVAIAAGSGTVFQLHNDGSIWRSTGQACANGGCPGWIELDNNPAATAIAAGAGTVFQLHNDGSIWRSTGQPCGNGCPGWTQLDNNPAAVAITAGSGTGGTVFQLHNDGSIWRSTGQGCGNGCPGWFQLDNNPAAVAITAGGPTVYQLHNDGSIWRSTGQGCANGGCPGWTQLDNNRAATAIVASSSTVYQLHNDGSIWVSTGVGCGNGGCPGWTELDNNPAAVQISVSNGS